MPDKAELLSASLAENRTRLQRRLGHAVDVTWRDVLLSEGIQGRRPGLVIYVSGMVDGKRLEEAIMRPLLESGVQLFGDGNTEQVELPVAGIHSASELSRLAVFVTHGFVCLLVDGFDRALALDIRNLPARPVSEPNTEVSVHGGHEGFATLLITNLGMLRRLFPTPELQLERLDIGSYTNTEVVLAYLKDRVNPDLLTELRHRLQQAKPKAIFLAEDLVEAISDRPRSLFPNCHITERPDMAARKLMKGRVAILTDNSPKVLLMPGTLLDHMVAVDDFYDITPFTVLVRGARVLALAFSIFLPSLYVALVSFHQQAAPTVLTLSLMAQREGAPLPTPVEAFVMVSTFEILREAGLRLPRQVGPSVSIVGGLVIGEAAMRAGIASPAMVLVVSATAISTFAIPSQTLSNAATVARLMLLLVASVLGFYGMMVVYLMLLAYVASLTSGHVSYGQPLMPLEPGLIKDALGAIPRPPYGPGPDMNRRFAEPPGKKGGK